MKNFIKNLKSQVKILQKCPGMSPYVREVADCSSTSLLKMNSFICIFERF